MEKKNAKEPFFLSSIMLHLFAGKPPVYQRSILLDERSKRLFLCNKESVRYVSSTRNFLSQNRKSYLFGIAIRNVPHIISKRQF